MSKKSLRNLLQDPSFVIVGILAGIVLPTLSFIVGGIVMPMLQHRWDNPKKSFTVTNTFKEVEVMSLLNAIDNEFSKKIEVLIEGKQCKGLKFASYRLSNTGEIPILVDDFVEPLTFSVEPPWKIIAVTSGLEWLGEKRLLDWEMKDEQHWEMKPTLFNPGDSVYTVVYATSNGSEDSVAVSQAESIFDFNARIVGVSSLRESPVSVVDLPQFLYTIIKLQGWSVYAFLVLWLLLLLLFLVLGSSSRILPSLRSRSVLLLVLGAGMAMASSEILTSIYQGYSGPEFRQWPGSWIILISYLVTVGYFSYRTFNVRRPKRRISRAKPLNSQDGEDT